MSKYIEAHTRWHRRPFTPRGRGALIVLTPVLFIVLFVVVPGWLASRWLPLPMGLGAAALPAGGAVAALGGALYLWTIVAFARARGTQVPLAPTQRLVSDGPYAVTRNPMVTATMFMVLGAGALHDSWSFVLAGMNAPLHYLLYIKLFEEKELEARFGEAYRAYRRATPFLLPRVSSATWRRRRSTSTGNRVEPGA